MGRKLTLAISGPAVLALLIASSGPARAMDNRQREPVRVYTVQPAPAGEAQRDTAKALLADRLGESAATSAAAAPARGALGAAEELPRRDAAVRRYGALRVSLYEMVDEPAAYALLRYTRPEAAGWVAAGDDAWASAGALALRVGHYAALLEGGDAASRERAAAALAERLGRPRPNAPLLSQLPGRARVAGSERYAPSFETLRRLRPDLAEDVFRFGAGGADAAVADYEQPGGAPMRVVLVDYQTPQLAADAERALQAHFAALPPDVQRQRLLKREGNFMLEATGVVDRAAAERILGEVDYSVSIKMLKGLDPVTVLNVNEETYKAALVFINSFMIVGLGFLGALACGIVVGTVVFRKRRRAAANLFSDAGGMTHLDLREQTKGLPAPAGHAGLLPSGPAD